MLIGLFPLGNSLLRRVCSKAFNSSDVIFLASSPTKSISSCGMWIISPIIMLSRLLFPEPTSPTITTNSPFLILRSMSLTLMIFSRERAFSGMSNFSLLAGRTLRRVLLTMFWVLSSSSCFFFLASSYYFSFSLVSRAGVIPQLKFPWMERAMPSSSASPSDFLSMRPFWISGAM